MNETSSFRGPGRRRDVQSLWTQSRFSTREAPAASRCGWPAGDNRPDASCGTRSVRQAAVPQTRGPRRQPSQQRKMGDELKLLGRMVLRCGAVGSAGEGVRVNDDEAIDTVGMREERDATPIPGKEYQQQRSACFPAVSQHRIQLDAAKILKSFGKFVQQASLRK